MSIPKKRGIQSLLNTIRCQFMFCFVCVCRSATIPSEILSSKRNTDMQTICSRDKKDSGSCLCPRVESTAWVCCLTPALLKHNDGQSSGCWI